MINKNRKETVIFWQNENFEPKVTANLKSTKFIDLLKHRIKIFFTLCLAVIFSFGMISNTKAELISCIDGLREDGVTACNKCGANCDWTVDTTSGKLSVSGSGAMYDYEYLSKEDKPWKSYTSSISSIEVEGLKTIGENAFSTCRKINEIKLGNTVETIKHQAFAWTGAKSVIMSDSIKSLQLKAFRGTNLSSVTLPYDVKIEKDSLGESNLSIICKGSDENCESLKSKLENYIAVVGNDLHDSPLNLSGFMKISGPAECASTIFYWNGTECVREPDKLKHKCSAGYSLDDDNNCVDCKKEGFKNVDGYCNRIRYTPAEAAAILNDNDNSVTITFKK